MQNDAMIAGQKTISFTLNGRSVSADVPSYWNVVDLLRAEGLFGARESCGQGMCGCCSVLVDGQAVTGCLMFAQMLDGKEVSTVESFADDDGGLSVVQTAFVEEFAFQCGFCTPGFIVMTEDLLRRNANPSDEDILHHLSGNLCRCATYPEIIKAVRRAAADLQATATQAT